MVIYKDVIFPNGDIRDITLFQYNGRKNKTPLIYAIAIGNDVDMLYYSGRNRRIKHWTPEYNNRKVVHINQKYDFIQEIHEEILNFPLPDYDLGTI